MEASPLPTSESENWAERFNESLALQRRRLRDFLGAQQERLRNVEAELDRQLRQLADELAQNRDQTRRATEEIRQRGEQLTRETESLEEFKQELAARQTQWEQLQQRSDRQQQAFGEQIQRQQDELDRRHQEFLGRRSEIDEAETKLHHDRHALLLQREEHAAEVEQLAKLSEDLQAKQTEFDGRSRQLTNARAEVDAGNQQLADAQAELDNQRQRLEEQQEEVGRRAELQQQLETAENRALELSAELEPLQERCHRLEQEVAQPPAAGADSKEMENLKAEREILCARLAEAEQRLAETSAGREATDDDLRRRYEMAMEDVRELKSENAELKEQAARSPVAATRAPAAEAATDWEAEKLRVLASLEADFDEEDEEAQVERLKIEELTEKTDQVVAEKDQVVAEKDQEIEDLKQLLQQQSTKVGTMAVGAAALGEILDDDAIIQEERESLKRMQEEWREKLRKAEVDISVERAKIARERAGIEDKIRQLEERGGDPNAQPGDSAKSGKPARGRWLARLGLSDVEEE